MEIIVRSTSLKDKSGERIWFPKDGKPYFDKAARRVFHTPEEKHNFMNSVNAVSTGDSDEKYKREVREHEERKMDERRK